MKNLIQLIISGLLAGIVLFLAVPSTVMAADEDSQEYWAVIVGVSEYADADDLEYSDDSAQGLYDLLAPAYGEDHIKLLLNRKASKNGIIAALRWMADNAGPEDHVLFYFAGHGSDQGHLAPFDAYTITTWLTVAELKAEMNRMKTDNKLVILDSCYAGYHEASLSDNGTVLLLATEAGEVGYQTSALDNGVFSYYILVALKWIETTDLNADHIVSAEEVFAYAAPRTEEWTSVYDTVQHPVLSDGCDGEMPVLEEVIVDANHVIPAVDGLYSVNGVDYSEYPFTAVQMPGRVNEIEVAPVVVPVSDTRYLFESWDDGDNSTSKDISFGVYGINYNVEYWFEISSAYGDVPESGWYPQGSTIDFSVPVVVEGTDVRHVFDGWEGQHTTNTAESSVFLWRPITTTAVWRDQYELTVDSNYGHPQGAGWYDDGTEAVISIEDMVESNGAKHHFAGWNGPVDDDERITVVKVDGPTSVEAMWVDEYEITVESEYGSVSGAGWYYDGDEVEINTTTSEGFLIQHVFVGWTGSLESREPDVTFTSSRPMALTAVWKLDLSQLFMVIGGVVIVAAVIIFLVRRRSSV